MEFCDLHRQYLEYKDEIDAAMASVIRETAFINGPAIAALESELAEWCGAPFVNACSSGSDAIWLALKALDVREGDEIICPAFTFISTASMVRLTGAVPVFADVETRSFNLDPEKIEAKLTPRTRGIIAVSLYGQCADMDAINKIAKKHGLWVLEDAAQSFGATYKGKYSCNLSDVATTSFFPAKPLGAYGDGGAIFTADPKIAETVRMLRNHGQEKRYYHKMIGMNGRMDTLQAAILRVKLRHFREEIKQRQRAAEHYSSLLKNVADIPKACEGRSSVWAQYTLRVPQRDTLREALKAAGIPTAVHYPMPLPAQEAFADLEQDGKFPVSDRLAETVISLPMHPFLTSEEIHFIADNLREALNE
ncbi:MAG: DegT/DnrJ/EryC1/StrS family aminotransferase [Candidatus Marinimicrobia bacterium]|nr:DegT/DnrJ/EryC1/StrS family aminotransferase [Candidatus Neomarinimicrobiota bacterium]